MSTSTYRQVKKVFEQTWRDYYEWSAPATLPLDLAKITHSLALDPSYLIFNQNEANEAATPNAKSTAVNDFPMQASKTHTYVAQTSQGAKPSAKPSSVPSSTGSSALSLPRDRLIPKYTSCLPVPRNILVPDENLLPFMPILSDDIEVEFPATEYQMLYGGKFASEEIGRDPSVDIICVETRLRLLDKGLTEADIDATRILPFTCSTIHAFDLERDLPAFPTEPSRLWSTPIDDISCRSWRPPLIVAEEEDSDRGWRDMDEVFCRESACHDYACTVHLGCGEIVPNPIRPKSSLIVPDQSRKRCSRMCHKAVAAGPGSWQDSERQALWTAYASGLTSSCDLRHVIARKSCAEIAAELEKILSEISKDSTEENRSAYLVPLSLRDRDRARAAKSKVVGCSCGSTRPGKGCVSKSCECVREGRECDPSLCRACSISCRLGEEIDPGCGNQRLLTGQHANLRVGVSAISGYGLFANEPIERDQPLGEYVGEIISDGEADKRGTIYNLIHTSYLFEIPRTALLDGAKVGGLTRFINNGEGASVNCGPRLLRTGKDQKIILFTTRKVKKGEEFLFNYGEKFHPLRRSEELLGPSEESTGASTPA